MMRFNRRSFKPMVEGCESRELLSGLSTHLGAAWVARVSGTKVVELNGMTHGHYVQTTVNPDVGSFVTLGGSGMVSGFGKAFVSGSVQSVGFIANGSARGTLVLAGPRGTLTLSLTGATQQSGPAPLPGTFTFKTVVGTDKFWNVHDQGTGSLTLTPNHSYGLVTQGTFSLVLTSYPVPAATRIG
jgi:hypothetical protein